MDNSNILTLNDERIKIRNFIKDQMMFIKGYKQNVDETDVKFTDETNLFDLGFFNSILLLILGAFIEKEFNVKVNKHDIEKAGNNTLIYCSVNSILNFLKMQNAQFKIEKKEVISTETETKQHHNFRTSKDKPYWFLKCFYSIC